MGRAKACLWGWALLLLIPAGAPGRCSAEEPTVSAFCREGQTFITWTELVEVSGERYAIYRCARPVTAATLADAQRLAD